ncbi:MAG TPA: hypothetical protein VI322_04960 [Candidatus Saccharimonadia bacterium]
MATAFMNLQLLRELWQTVAGEVRYWLMLAAIYAAMLGWPALLLLIPWRPWIFWVTFAIGGANLCLMLSVPRERH